MFTGIVATHPQPTARSVVEVFDAQHAVVFYGIDLAVDDLGAASVDGEGGALLDDVDHAVVDHVGAQGAVGFDGEGLQDVQGDADAFSTSIFSG